MVNFRQMKRPTPAQGLKAMIRFGIVCFFFAMTVNFIATHYHSRYPSTSSSTSSSASLARSHDEFSSSSYFPSWMSSSSHGDENDEEEHHDDDDDDNDAHHLHHPHRHRRDDSVDNFAVSYDNNNNNNNNNIGCSSSATNKRVKSEPLKTEYTDMDVVIVMVAPVCTTQQVVERLNFHYHFRKIYFVVKQVEICPYLRSLAKNIICLDENEVIPGVTYSSLSERGEKLKQIGQKEGSNRVGWYLQQYLKLGVALHVKDLSEYYLVWDADNIATRPLELVKETTKSENYAVRFCANPVTHKSCLLYTSPSPRD